MRSIDELRSLIDNDDQYSDDELRDIECRLEQLADLAFEMWLADREVVRKMSE